jgi:hypothetical protein
VCAHLEKVRGVLALDGDVLASGALAVADGRNDYAGLWRYLLSIAFELALNSMPVVLCHVCRPEQVLCHDEVKQFDAVHFLALVCDEAVWAERLRRRGGRRASDPYMAESQRVNRDLKGQQVSRPHTFTPLDTSCLTQDEVNSFAVEWFRDRLLAV